KCTPRSTSLIADYNALVSHAAGFDQSVRYNTASRKVRSIQRTSESSVVRCSFVHFGDVHLGTQQYDCPERLNDFARAWLFACQYIANARPDFAICTGDLFNRFTINPVTFDQAYSGLSMLREAGVP